MNKDYNHEALDAFHKKIDAFRFNKIKNEAHLENYFCKEIKNAGGWALKLNPSVVSGLPDRIVFYRGFTWLVELKTPKGIVGPGQKAIHDRFKVYGFEVRVLRTKEEVQKFIDQMRNIEL